MASSDDRFNDSSKPTSGWTRRQFLPLLGATAAATLSSRALFAAPSGEPGRPSDARARYVYVGTYTPPNIPPGGTHPSSAVGIYVFKMDPSDGNLLPVQVVAASNPSFVALDPTLTHVYSVNEDNPGRVSAYSLDPSTGKLSFINSQAANGSFTTHISVHPSGLYTMAANYGTGNFPVFPIIAGGNLAPMSDAFQSTGYAPNDGPNHARQDGPHAHQILTDPDAVHVYGVDLGADKVNVLNLDLVAGTLTPNHIPFALVASGSGPRHMAFHPDRVHAYVLDELVSTITVFAFDEARGTFIWLQTISTLPERFTEFNTTAEIRVHPSGRFLYNTNRGHDTVTMYEIDAASGKLDVIGWESTRGHWPRGMNIDPSGTFLYAANQDTDTIAVFRIQPSNGKLKFSTLVLTPTPVDVEFGPLA
jgi:6-phosphogluconolactonase